MSNQALTWAYGLHLGSAPQKAVLLYLADRAQPDGAVARPSVATIVTATEFCESAVRKALSALEKRGLIRRGDQRHAALGREGSIIPANRRAVVWDLCMDIPLEDFQEAIRQADQDTTCEDMEAAVEQKTAVTTNEALASISYTPDEDLTCTSYTSENGLACTTYRSRGVPGTPKPSYKPIYPSTPTGYLPEAEHPETEHSGAEHGEVENCYGGLPERAARQDAKRLADMLACVRRELGLAAPKAQPRDLAGLELLLVALGRSSNGRVGPFERVAAVVRWLPSCSWWLKKVRRARDLARWWDELSNDFDVSLLDVASTGKRAAADLGEPPVRHVHTWACRHVLDALGLRDQSEVEDLDAAYAKAVELNQADNSGVVV